MKSVILAITITLSATASMAGVPGWGLPDLTFPDPVTLPAPDISTQGCLPTAACRN
ncbi:hypothetical protein [Thetidibacter halocola]|uniref:Uncharacterized protein n=1 Tax=Thetidibacter halocola TaxID=2827239 RepID=A0A8J7W9H7_9RHOB|nr:hypothetical protein [Thetidibacter halocola]MBS0123365.1 hypothetical protein [Thetidibacter halocola]